MYISTHRWSNDFHESTGNKEGIETPFTRDGGIESVDVLLDINTAIGVHDRPIAPVDESQNCTVKGRYNDEAITSWLYVFCDLDFKCCCASTVGRSRTCEKTVPLTEMSTHVCSSHTCKHFQPHHQRCLSKPLDTVKIHHAPKETANLEDPDNTTLCR
jgi:hypothetical protein